MCVITKIKKCAEHNLDCVFVKKLRKVFPFVSREQKLKSRALVTKCQLLGKYFS